MVEKEAEQPMLPSVQEEGMSTGLVPDADAGQKHEIEQLKESEDNLLMENLRLQRDNDDLTMENEQMTKRLETVFHTLRDVWQEITEEREALSEAMEQRDEFKRRSEAKDAYISSLTEDCNRVLRQREEENQRLSIKLADLETELTAQNAKLVAEMACQQTVDLEGSRRMEDTIREMEAELLKVKEVRQRLSVQLEQSKFELEQVLNSDEGKELEAKIRHLENKLSELETEKEEEQLGREDKLKELESTLEKATADAKERRESSRAREEELQLRCEKAEAGQRDFETKMLEAEGSAAQLLKEKMLLQEQLNVAMLNGARLGQQEPAYTRIEMEESVPDCNEKCYMFPHHPLVAKFQCALEVAHRELAWATTPVSQSLLNRIRAICGRQPIRPYIRLLLVLYFITIHLVVLNYCLS